MKVVRWPSKAPTARALRKAGGRTALAVLLAVLNPFGIRDWTEARSHENWQQLYAPYYAPSPESRQRQARDEIAIVLIDDASRNALANRHDIDSLDVAQMIEDVIEAPGAGAAPRAVFVDLLLGDAAPRSMSEKRPFTWPQKVVDACTLGGRSNIDSPFQCLLITVARFTAYDRWKDDPICRRNNLEKVLCIEHAGGIPILFADPAPPFEGGVGPDAQASLTVRALGEVGATVPVEVEPHEYPLVRRGAHRDSLMLYPAAALYAASCERQGCAPSPIAVEATDWSPKFKRDVDVVWGVDVPRARESERPFTRMIRRLQGDSAVCRTWPRDPWSSIKRFVHLATAGIDTPSVAACAYTDAIPYRFLQSGITPQETRQALGGKVVLLGSHVLGDNDSVAATPYGALPGVFLHAMALDNLMQRGANYPKAPVRPVPGLTLTSVNLIDLATVFGTTFGLAILTAGIAARNASGRPISARGWARRIGLLLSFVMVVFWLMFILSGGVGIMPETFNIAVVGIACVIGLGELAAEVFEPAWKPLLARIRRREPGPKSAGGG